jgi:HSP20 family protein
MAVVQRNQARDGSTGLARPMEGGAVPLSQAMDRLFRESFLMPSMLDSFFGSPGAWGGQAGSNLYETSDGYMLQLVMPGVKADSINCTIEQGVLTVTAEPAVQPPEGARTIWQTFGGAPEYRIQLPEATEAGEARADYHDGVLTIQLPKPAHAKPQTIKVTAA